MKAPCEMEENHKAPHLPHIFRCSDDSGPVNVNLKKGVDKSRVWNTILYSNNIKDLRETILEEHILKPPEQHRFVDLLSTSLCDRGVFVWSPETKDVRVQGFTYPSNIESSIQLLGYNGDISGIEFRHRNTEDIQVFYENPWSFPYVGPRRYPYSSFDVEMFIDINDEHIKDWYANLVTLLSLYKDVELIEPTENCVEGDRLFLWDGTGTFVNKTTGQVVYGGYRELNYSHTNPRAPCLNFNYMIISDEIKYEPSAIGRTQHNKMFCFSNPRKTKAYFVFLEKPVFYKPSTNPESGDVKYTPYTHVCKDCTDTSDTSTCYDYGSQKCRVPDIAIDGLNRTCKVNYLSGKLPHSKEYICPNRTTQMTAINPCNYVGGQTCTWIPFRAENTNYTEYNEHQCPFVLNTTIPQHEIWESLKIERCKCHKKTLSTSHNVTAVKHIIPADLIYDAYEYMCNPFYYDLRGMNPMVDGLQGQYNYYSAPFTVNNVNCTVCYQPPLKRIEEDLKNTIYRWLKHTVTFDVPSSYEINKEGLYQNEIHINGVINRWRLLHEFYFFQRAWIFMGNTPELHSFLKYYSTKDYSGRFNRTGRTTALYIAHYATKSSQFLAYEMTNKAWNYLSLHLNEFGLVMDPTNITLTTSSYGKVSLQPKFPAQIYDIRQDYHFYVDNKLRYVDSFQNLLLGSLIPDELLLIFKKDTPVSHQLTQFHTVVIAPDTSDDVQNVYWGLLGGTAGRPVTIFENNTKDIGLMDIPVWDELYDPYIVMSSRMIVDIRLNNGIETFYKIWFSLLSLYKTLRFQRIEEACYGSAFTIWNGLGHLVDKKGNVIWGDEVEAVLPSFCPVPQFVVLENGLDVNKSKIVKGEDYFGINFLNTPSFCFEGLLNESKSLFIFETLPNLSGITTPIVRQNVFHYGYNSDICHLCFDRELSGICREENTDTCSKQKYMDQVNRTAQFCTYKEEVYTLLLYSRCGDYPVSEVKKICKNWGVDTSPYSGFNFIFMGKCEYYPLGNEFERSQHMNRICTRHRYKSKVINEVLSFINDTSVNASTTISFTGKKRLSTIKNYYKDVYLKSFLDDYGFNYTAPTDISSYIFPTLLFFVNSMQLSWEGNLDSPGMIYFYKKLFRYYSDPPQIYHDTLNCSINDSIRTLSNEELVAQYWKELKQKMYEFGNTTIRDVSVIKYREVMEEELKRYIKYVISSTVLSNFSPPKLDPYQEYLEKKFVSILTEYDKQLSSYLEKETIKRYELYLTTLSCTTPPSTTPRSTTTTTTGTHGVHTTPGVFSTTLLRSTFKPPPNPGLVPSSTDPVPSTEDSSSIYTTPLMIGVYVVVGSVFSIGVGYTIFRCIYKKKNSVGV